FRRMPTLQRALTLVLPVALSGVVACTSAGPTAAPPAAPTPAAAKPAASPATVASPSPSASAVASPSAVAGAAPRPANASLSISSPTPGQTVPAGSVRVSVQWSGPLLVAAASATKLDDYHLHYFLDESATAYLGTLVPVPMGNPHIVH